MLQYDGAEDILSLYSYFCSRHMLKSILARKQAGLITDGDRAMILWGPSIMIGGEFSESFGETLKDEVLNSPRPLRFINSPDGAWKSYINETFSGYLTDKQVNLYEALGIVNPDCPTSPSITPITKAWLERDLPNTRRIRDEMYSYLSDDDFFENGYGLALVIDGTVFGYCLSEYSIDNECAINIWIDEKYRCLGYAKMMTGQFLAHNSGKWKIYWGCDSDNVPSNRVAIASGFILRSKQSYFEWERR